MKLNIKLNVFISTIIVLSSVVVGCTNKLDKLEENNNFTGGTDFTKTEDMKLSLIGMYAAFQDRGWEQPMLLSVRGDDVNAGGLGDQQDFADTDMFTYNKDYWMYNSLWENVYVDVITAHTAMEQIARYQEFANPTGVALGDQYIAEIKVLRAKLLFDIARVWGDVFIPTSSNTNDLLAVTELPSKDEVMEHILEQMTEAIPMLPDSRPNERVDVPGGVTKYTALAIMAMASQELKDYQGVADATSQIIDSGKFSLFSDYYELFKTSGKLSNESLLELQYSDFGQGQGDREGHLFDPYGPQNWTPQVAGSGSGWGFYEPSIKYIKFMLDRNETVRLETSVLFTDRGIAELQNDSNYSSLPSFVSNTTRDGDIINDYSRALFSSGKHYLPSNQLITGRTAYGSNKNFNVIRYSEILLMYAEALVHGASGTTLTADDAVNKVRNRAGLTNVSGVDLQAVMDEKFAELGMEWGIRYYDMVRLEMYNELSYDGRTFTQDKVYLPYPQKQVDQFPILK